MTMAALVKLQLRPEGSTLQIVVSVRYWQGNYRMEPVAAHKISA